MNKLKANLDYINWDKEAEHILLPAEEMIKLLKELKEKRSVIGKSNKAPYRKTDSFDLSTYQIIQKGDYVSVYLYEKGGFKVYSNNTKDMSKNAPKANIGRVDRLFDFKFRELNGISIRKAFGFVPAMLKCCIPKQFYYKNDKYISVPGKIKVLTASSIDASSQYPSGCLGRLPDAHTAKWTNGIVKPTEEWPFAFYNDGHCAEYGVFDTHDWLSGHFAQNLFRFDQKHKYCLMKLPEDQLQTVLMKPSSYTMDSTWEYFYDRKKNCEKETAEYEEAKLVMNKTIGMWHRKDKDEKTKGADYDDHGSYQLAHIVAIAIARGNQKILNKIEEIGAPYIYHVCVDGIIYMGSEKEGIDETAFGRFAQEFIGAKFVMTDYNNYIALQGDKCIKFKHGSYDLLYGQEIDENRDFIIEDLFNLSQKERVSNYLKEIYENGEETDLI